MTITIDLPQAVLDQVQAEASARGKDLETFVREAIEARLLRRRQTFAEAIQPIQDAIAASGMTPEQAESLFEREVLAARHERNSSITKP